VAHNGEAEGFLWLLSEIALNLITRTRGGAENRDRASITILWGAFTLGFVGAVLGQNLLWARIAMPRDLLHAVGLLLVTSGIVIRAFAVMALGRFFNAAVTIHNDHRLIRSGMFRRVRHPSYSGLLLAFSGLSLLFRNWISVVALLGPALAAILYRIRIEEAALVGALGSEYSDYQHTTKRLIPGIF
jgi:protein-S-isoprenylcysteine O-methyltransferase Ste14